mgnify:CR=1 FL=1
MGRIPLGNGNCFSGTCFKATFLILKQLNPKEVNLQGITLKTKLQDITLKTKLQDITLKISYKVKRGPKKRKEKKRIRPKQTLESTKTFNNQKLGYAINKSKPHHQQKLYFSSLQLERITS